MANARKTTPRKTAPQKPVKLATAGSKISKTVKKAAPVRKQSR